LLIDRDIIKDENKGLILSGARMVEAKENRTFFNIERIISGGQTGADRAALDVALELGISCGGWCPKGRKAEDGPIDTYYPLRETTSANYSVRTERNVRESDGTLILANGQPRAGTALTIKFAQKHKKPHIVRDPFVKKDLETVRMWLELNKIRVLNVAGPRESEVPGIHDRAFEFLKDLFVTPKAGQVQQTPPQQT
jgi:hypothetical protein